jgi:hypothetical protein
MGASPILDIESIMCASSQPANVLLQRGLSKLEVSINSKDADIYEHLCESVGIMREVICAAGIK